MKTRYEQLKEEMKELSEAIHEGMESGEADAISDAITSLAADLKHYEHIERAIAALFAKRDRVETALDRKAARGIEVDWSLVEQYEETITYFENMLEN